MDEILSLSDRIAVMYNGEIVAILDAAKASREELGLLMAGSHTEENEENDKMDKLVKNRPEFGKF
ncbi:MAG: hypothetical protein ACK2U3_09355 [Anaerolineales bacterium]